MKRLMIGPASAINSLSLVRAALIMGAVLGAPHAQGASSAPTAEDIKKAAEAFDRGREAYRLEAYGEAAENFESADSSAPSAAALRLAMLSRAEAGQLARALTLAALALELYPNDDSIVSDAKTLLANAESLGKLNISCDEACDLVLDNKIVHGVSAESRTLFVDPGEHTVRAHWSGGRAKSLGVRLGAGGHEELDFFAPTTVVERPSEEPRQMPEPDPLAEPERNGWSPAVFWTGTALTAGGVIATSILGVRAVNDPGVDAVREQCTGLGTECALYQQGLANQTAANVALGATIAVGVFTIVTGLWLTDWGPDDDQGVARREPVTWRKGQFSVTPTLNFGDGLGVVGASGRF